MNVLLTMTMQYVLKIMIVEEYVQSVLEDILAIRQVFSLKRSLWSMPLFASLI